MAETCNATHGSATCDRPLGHAGLHTWYGRPCSWADGDPPPKAVQKNLDTDD